MDSRIYLEPARQRLDLSQSAESAGEDMLNLDIPPFKKNEEVTVGRREILRQLQEVQRNWQWHFGKTTNLEAGDTEQDTWGKSSVEDLQSIFLSAQASGENKDHVRRAQRIGAG